MFDLEQQIKVWRRDLTNEGIKRPEVLEELEDHLRGQIARLIGSGSTKEEAFRSAAQQLGKTEVLKQEFSKVKRHGFWSVRSNPLTLIILASWFVITGLESLRLFMLYFAVGEWWPSRLVGNLNPLHWHTCFLLLTGCLQIFIGIGLFRRQNGWRITALAASLYQLCLIPFYIYNICSNYGMWTSRGAFPSVAYEFMGLRLPMVFICIVPVLGYAVACWAIYMLTKSSMRNQFRRSATK